jgi:hypothetical protein
MAGLILNSAHYSYSDGSSVDFTFDGTTIFQEGATYDLLTPAYSSALTSINTNLASSFGFFTPELRLLRVYQNVNTGITELGFSYFDGEYGMLTAGGYEMDYINRDGAHHSITSGTFITTPTSVSEPASTLLLLAGLLGLRFSRRLKSS